MNRRYRRKRKEHKLKHIIFKHIENNMKNYAIVSIIFLIGIVIGVIFINNISEDQTTQITDYITSFLQELKGNKNIDNLLLIKDSIKKNIILVAFLWFMGATVIGMFFVYLTICFRGFCLGYTISSIIFTLGIRKGVSIFTFFTFISNHFIYSLHISTSSKWNEHT